MPIIRDAANYKAFLSRVSLTYYQLNVCVYDQGGGDRMQGKELLKEMLPIPVYLLKP